jgi:hypothetical protein
MKGGMYFKQTVVKLDNWLINSFNINDFKSSDSFKIQLNILQDSKF